MKKLALIVACLTAGYGAFAQGTVDFRNRISGGVLNVPIFNVDGTTPLGAGYNAQLYYATSASGPFTAITDPAVTFPLNPTSGAGPGYWFAGTDSSRTIPTIAGGATAFLEVKAWKTSEGATFETASTRGASTPFSITLGGAGSPPSLPAVMTGLTSFSLVPEPSTIALGLLGVGALLIRRRK